MFFNVKYYLVPKYQHMTFSYKIQNKPSISDILCIYFINSWEWCRTK